MTGRAVPDDGRPIGETMSAVARFRASVEQADAKAMGPDADAVDECEALRWAVEAAEEIVRDLAALADFANGEVDPEDPDGEPDYPSGADMVDEVNAMLARIGFEV